MGDLPWDDIVVPPDADVEALKKEIGVWCADPFFVRFGGDSGGKHLEPFIDDDRQVYCSWLDEDPWYWSWVEEEEAEVISASR